MPNSVCLPRVKVWGNVPDVTKDVDPETWMRFEEKARTYHKGERDLGGIARLYEKYGVRKRER